MTFKVTKTFPNLPVAHCQYQDVNEDGSPGACAAFHGYDRSVTVQISADSLDEYGWVFPFGAFKEIRNFLEYYYDHTAVIPASDPRLEAALAAKNAGILGTLRVLPYGVSMEMCSLHLYENIARYVWEQSDGRCFVTRIEFREHEKNSGELELSLEESRKYTLRMVSGDKEQLVMKSVHEAESAPDAVNRILCK